VTRAAPPKEALVASRSFWKIPLAALLLLAACAAGARGQAASYGPRAARSPRTDAQVIRDLTARDEGRASRAAGEVGLRGARMIPHLMRLKGDRRCFFGDMALGSHVGGSYRLMPEKADGCYEESSSSTVEVAALFLFEAVYRDDLKFAQGATLARWDEKGEQRTGVKLNGRELVGRAWADAERWFKDFEREGLEALRARGRGPFDKKRVGFF
jgi:hypothetical protein